MTTSRQSIGRAHNTVWLMARGSWNQPAAKASVVPVEVPLVSMASFITATVVVVVGVAASTVVVVASLGRVDVVDATVVVVSAVEPM
jgi:hypothetical protein